MFDELKILISGDTSGIQSSMKKALNIVQGGVDKMNDQEVDWTSIFSRSVSPAIISAVASVFAFAIGQSMQFQSAMNQTGTAAGLSSDQIGKLGQNSLDLASNTGQSANDIASAYASVAHTFQDAATQQEFVTDASKLAASGFGDLSDIISSALPLMQMFGVTTAQQVNQVFTQLMHGAEGSGESLASFAAQFLSVAPDLKAGGATLSDLNNLLAGFSAEISNLGVDQATAAFKVFGSAVSGADPALNAMLGSSQHLLDVLKTQGLPQALAEMGEKIKASGESAVLLYKNFGLSTVAIDGLEASSAQLPKIAVDAQSIAKNAQSIADAFNQSDSAIREFQKDWAKVQALVTSNVIATVVMDIAKGLGLVLDAEKWILDHSLQVTKAVVEPWSEMSNIITKIPSLIQSVFSGNAISTLEGVFGKVSGSVSSLLGTQSSGLNSALQGTGVGFNQSSLDRIDQKASSSGLIDSLVSALQNGIKGGSSANLQNTFNLTVPKGSEGLTAKQIATQLYNNFNGQQ